MVGRLHAQERLRRQQLEIWKKESFFQATAFRDRSGPAAILERFCYDLIDEPMRRHQL